MNIKVDKIVDVSQDGFQVRGGKALLTFAHNGHDKAVIKVAEAELLIKLLQAALDELKKPIV